MTNAVRNKDKYKDLMRIYDSKIQRRLNVKDKDIDLNQVPHWNRLLYNESDPIFVEEFEKVISDDGIPDADDLSQGATALEEDLYINMEIGLPRGPDGEVLHAKVKGRTLNFEGK